MHRRSFFRRCLRSNLRLASSIFLPALPSVRSPTCIGDLPSGATLGPISDRHRRSSLRLCPQSNRRPSSSIFPPVLLLVQSPTVVGDLPSSAALSPNLRPSPANLPSGPCPRINFQLTGRCSSGPTFAASFRLSPATAPSGPALEPTSGFLPGHQLGEP